MRFPVLSRIARLISLLLLATLGTAILTRNAPGYFADEGEMNAQSADVTRTELALKHKRESNLAATWASSLAGLVHGDLGQSKQFQVPVAELMENRVRVTAKLLALALPVGMLLAFACALPCSVLRVSGAHGAFAFVSTLLLAVPVSVLTSFCLVSGHGGPVAVLLALIAARDFRFISRSLRHHLLSPSLLYASASGIRTHRLLLQHLLLPMRREFLALFAMSFVVALNAVIPIEVLFGIPGVGQLAWGAAMNRDLPVLLAVTMLMALCIGAASLLTLRKPR